MINELGAKLRKFSIVLFGQACTGAALIGVIQPMMYTQPNSIELEYHTEPALTLSLSYSLLLFLYFSLSLSLALSLSLSHSLTHSLSLSPCLCLHLLPSSSLSLSFTNSLALIEPSWMRCSFDCTSLCCHVHYKQNLIRAKKRRGMAGMGEPWKNK